MLDTQGIKFNDMQLDPKHRSTFLDQFDPINRGNYCTTGTFYIEQLLMSINSYLKESEKNDGYSVLIKKMLIFLDRTQANDILDNRNYIILNTSAQIRNTLHNNGYAGRDYKIIIDGQIYPIVKGQRLEWTGWPTLYKIFDALIELLNDIFGNNKIKNIRFIPELYRSEQGI